jgi:hypothetical protein
VIFLVLPESFDCVIWELGFVVNEVVMLFAEQNEIALFVPLLQRQGVLTPRAVLSLSHDMRDLTAIDRVLGLITIFEQHFATARKCTSISGLKEQGL